MDFYICEILAGLAAIFFGGGVGLALILLACISREKDHNKKGK